MSQKGTGKFGPDVIVYSPEYWRLYREANKEKMRAAQMRYKMKQRQAYLATKLAVEEGITIDQALEEVGVALKKINIVKDEWEKSGRIPSSHRGDSHIPTNEELNIDPDAPNAFELEMVKGIAQKQNISFEDAFRITRHSPDTWDEAFAKCEKV